MELPCTFEDALPELHGYEGIGWFAAEWNLPNGWDDEASAEYQDSVDYLFGRWLRLGGVAYQAQIWLDGELAAELQDGFLPQELDLREYLRGSRLRVAIRTDNTRRAGEVPGVERGWRPYGGLLRQAVVEPRYDTHIAHAEVTALDADHLGNARLRLRLRRLTGAPGPVAIGVAIRPGPPEKKIIQGGCILVFWDPDFTTRLHLGMEVRELEFQFQHGEVEPWHPDRPCLYRLEVVVSECPEEDPPSCWTNPVRAAELTFGFRTIEVRGPELVLNGEPIVLRGFNRHEDSPRTGMKPDPEQARRDLAHMKSLGANFVRLCHYPHDPTTLALCDELGLLAMAEIPLYWWNSDSETPEQTELKLAAAKRQLTRLIARDRHHPSVILWCVSNETKENCEPVRRGNAELIRLAKSLDPSRLATHVSYSADPDFLEDDVVCVNGYPTWENLQFGRSIDPVDWWRRNLEKVHAMRPDCPIIVSEFGYPAVAGVHDGSLSEEAQAAAIETEFAALDASYVVGTVIWCYADHPWPEEDFIRRMTTSPLGVVSRNRQPKKSVATVARLFGREVFPCEDIPIRMVFVPEEGRFPYLRGTSNDINWFTTPLFQIYPRETNDDTNWPTTPPFEFYHIPGYSIRQMKLTEISLWTDVQRDAEPFMDIDEGLFLREFGSNLDAVPKRCYLITGPKRQVVGTISAWYDGPVGRIHWLAIRPSHRGRGLARAALDLVLSRLAGHHADVHLFTSSGRPEAVKLYLDAGFRLDMEQPNAEEARAQLWAKLGHPALLP